MGISFLKTGTPSKNWPALMLMTDHIKTLFLQAAWKVWASDLSKNYKATWMPHTTVVKSFADSELQALFSCPADSFVNLPGTSLRCEYVTLCIKGWAITAKMLIHICPKESEKTRFFISHSVR